MGMFSDDFNRADNTDLGANWDAGYTALTNLQIVGNEVRTGTVNTDAWETVNAFSPVSGQFAQATIVTAGNGVNSLASIILRGTAPATITGYEFRASFNAAAAKSSVRRWVGGVSTTLEIVNTGTNWADGDVLRAEISFSDRLLMKRGSTIVVSLSDPGGIVAPGRVGAKIFVPTGGAAGDVELDNFSAGDLEPDFGPQSNAQFPRPKLRNPLPDNTRVI